MRKNVLILSLIFSPDNVSTAQLMAGLAGELRRRGHGLAVITTTPHYHRDESLEAKQPLRNLFLGLVRRSDYEGIPVYHVAMPDKNCRKLLRMISWVFFHAMSTVVGVCIRFKPDVIIAPSPPLSIGINAWLLAKLRRAQFIYNVQELYPDIAVNLGVVRNRRVIGWLERAERFIYKRALAVVTITKSIDKKVRERVDDPSKVHLIPNFVALDEVVEVARRNEFTERLGIAERFVVTYAGNLGVPQNLWLLVEMARELKVEDGITLLIVGDGTEREGLERVAREEGLECLKVVDYQPLSVMPMIYAGSDMFYVGQMAGAHTDGIPSKIYRIFGYGKPVLAVTPRGSDLAECIEESGGGVVVEVEGEDSNSNSNSNSNSDSGGNRGQETGDGGRGRVSSRQSAVETGDGRQDTEGRGDFNTEAQRYRGTEEGGSFNTEAQRQRGTEGEECLSVLIPLRGASRSECLNGEVGSSKVLECGSLGVGGGECLSALVPECLSEASSKVREFGSSGVGGGECLSVLVPECLSGEVGSSKVLECGSLGVGNKKFNTETWRQRGTEGDGSWRAQCAGQFEGKKEGDNLNHLPDHFLNHKGKGREGCLSGGGGGSGSTPTRLGCDPTEGGRDKARPSKGVGGNSALCGKREGMVRHSPEWQEDDADREIGVPLGGDGARRSEAVPGSFNKEVKRLLEVVREMGRDAGVREFRRGDAEAQPTKAFKHSGIKAVAMGRRGRVYVERFGLERVGGMWEEVLKF